jgi:hypothetical protein
LPRSNIRGGRANPRFGNLDDKYHLLDNFASILECYEKNSSLENDSDPDKNF